MPNRVGYQKSREMLDGKFAVGNPDSSHPDAQMRHPEIDGKMRFRLAHRLGIKVNHHPPSWQELRTEIAFDVRRKAATEVGLPPNASWVAINQAFVAKRVNNTTFS